ncbi:MAG: transcription elongation factor GreA [Planctomycetaceae bacterium]|nr:transcription elongation factor GreA [Planctomycetaceae bacterium]
MDRQPISRKGYDKIKAEIAKLEDDISKVAEQIKLAREEGDLSENAEYHGQRETQGMLQAKVNQLKSKLADCYIVDPSSMPKDEVCFGSIVTVKDVSDGLEEQYQLVGPGEEDYNSDPMKILTSSPIAQGLIGKKVGDQSEVEIPAGQVTFEIVAIDFEDE